MIALFLDNNVLIGYIFETDHWNSKSLKVINSPHKKFSSNTVKSESFDIFNKNIRIIKMEIQKTIAEINRSKSFEPIKMLSFVADFYSKGIIIEYFNENPKKNKIEWMNGLRDLFRNAESRCLTNFQSLDKLVTFCARNESYKEIYNLFEVDGLAQIDLTDIEIILDAHHVGLQVKDLFLITGDYMHIVPRRNLIKNNTSLKDVIGLGEFNTNI